MTNWKIIFFTSAIVFTLIMSMNANAATSYIETFSLENGGAQPDPAHSFVCADKKYFTAEIDSPYYCDLSNGYFPSVYILNSPTNNFMQATGAISGYPAAGIIYKSSFDYGIMDKNTIISFDCAWAHYNPYFYPADENHYMEFGYSDGSNLTIYFDNVFGSHNPTATSTTLAILGQQCQRQFSYGSVNDYPNLKLNFTSDMFTTLGLPFEGKNLISITFVLDADPNLDWTYISLDNIAVINTYDPCGTTFIEHAINCNWLGVRNFNLTSPTNTPQTIFGRIHDFTFRQGLLWTTLLAPFILIIMCVILVWFLFMLIADLITGVGKTTLLNSRFKK